MFRLKIRFGGAVSFIQKLEDATDQLPAEWMKPIWRGFLSWLKKVLQDYDIRQTMRQVDQQAAAISEQWAQAEDEQRRQEVENAAARIQFENPNATVSVITTAVGEGSGLAILVEHPPDGSAAQDALGGAMEIRSPWTERQ
jgi:hypothetical protein